MRKALIAVWQGLYAKIILDKNCFRAPLLRLLPVEFDAGYVDQIASQYIYFLLHWIGAAQRLH